MPWPKDPEKLELAKKRMSESLKGKTAWNKGLKGCSCGWPKGKPMSVESRLKMAESQKGNKNAKGHIVSDEVKKIISDANKGNQSQLGRKHTEEECRKISEAKAGVSPWNKGKHFSEESRRKMSDSRKGKEPWNKGKSDVYSAETLKVMSEAKQGEKSPAWNGGKSFEPYCTKFNNAFKERIRDKFKRSCFLCGAHENGKRHHVHHIDYNKTSICNGRSWAFVTLCSPCHTKTNFNRWYWFNLLINYWALNPEITL